MRMVDLGGCEIEEAMTDQETGAKNGDAGGKLEGLAFQFCKIATVSLLAGRYVLPVSAGLCACLYFAAYFKGKRESRCILRYPLLIGAFWLAVTAGWFMVTLGPLHFW